MKVNLALFQKVTHVSSLRRLTHPSHICWYENTSRLSVLRWIWMNVTRPATGCIGITNLHLSHYHKQWFIGGGAVVRSDYLKLSLQFPSLRDRRLTEERYYLCYFNPVLHLKAGGEKNTCQFSFRRLIYFELLLKLKSLWGFFHNDFSSTVYVGYTLPRLNGPSLIKSVNSVNLLTGM